MTFKTGARIQETSSTTGTGTWTLLGAPTGFQSFSVLGNNNLTPYFATDGTNWEEGIGTVLTGPNRLARTHVLDSSNAGAAVNFTSTVTIRSGPIGKLAVPRKLTKSVAGSGTVTLTQDEQRYDIIEFTGALSGNVTVEVDATPWNWVVYNNTSGAFTLTMKVAGQTGVALTQGRRAAFYCDGADVSRGGIAPSSTDREFASGTAIVFQQTAAPVGWTKQTSHNDKALRVVSGSVGSGGATAFTSVFGAGKTTGSHTLTAAESGLMDHGHTASGAIIVQSSVGATFPSAADGSGLPLTNKNVAAQTTLAGTVSVGVNNSGSSGASSGHTHTLSLDLQYVDVIMATKD